MTRTEDGMFILIKLEQFSNAQSEMIVTDDGIFTLVKDLHW